MDTLVLNADGMPVNYLPLSTVDWQEAIQYCNTHLTKKDCTLDHVLPTSLGGKTTFENTTTACGPCNANKGANKKIVPKVKPYKPDYYELINKRKMMPFHVRHDSWLDYLQV